MLGHCSQNRKYGFKLVQPDIVNSTVSSKFVLADSAGFWIVLFCGFGLIMLWTASSRIAKRSNESAIRYRAAKIRVEDQKVKIGNHSESIIRQNAEAKTDGSEIEFSANESYETGLMFGDNRLLIGGLSLAFVFGAALVARDWFAYRSQLTS